MKRRPYRTPAICGLAVAALMSQAQTTPVEPTDSLTAAAASILGTSLRVSIDNIEGLGVRLDREELKRMIGDIIDGGRPVYSYDRAYAIIDAGVADRQRSYVDSVFSAEAQQAFIDKEIGRASCRERGSQRRRGCHARQRRRCGDHLHRIAV